MFHAGGRALHRRCMCLSTDHFSVIFWAGGQHEFYSGRMNMIFYLSFAESSGEVPERLCKHASARRGKIVVVQGTKDICFNREVKRKRRGARAVEWDGLENRCGGNSTQGSNPCLSASYKLKIMKSCVLQDR